MVFTQLKRGLERNEDTMIGGLPDEVSHNRVLLGEDLVGVVVAHHVLWWIDSVWLSANAVLCETKATSESNRFRWLAGTVLRSWW
jgi:hypothetical protein